MCVWCAHAHTYKLKPASLCSPLGGWVQPPGGLGPTGSLKAQDQHTCVPDPEVLLHTHLN